MGRLQCAIHSSSSMPGMPKSDGLMIVSLDAPGTQLGAHAVYNVTTGQLLEFGLIEFNIGRAERQDLASLARMLDQTFKRYHPRLLVCEHPFLHVIAQFVGAVKMWACRKRGLRWYMINPSQAQKLVFGKALHKKRTTRTGRVVSDSAWKKLQVMRYIQKRFHLPKSLTQHEADAIFYAVAVAEKLRREHAVIRRA